MVWTLLLLLGCPSRAEVVDLCAEDVVDTGACRPCGSDADCGLSGNSCTDTVYCGHREISVPVVDLGCSKALEHPWPDEEDCVCAEACTWVGK